MTHSHGQFGGPWTIEKLDILEGYLNAYTTAFKNQSFDLIYIDAFAGTGRIRLPNKHEIQGLIRGSAERALHVTNPPFSRLVFVEQDSERCHQLERLHGRHDDRKIEIRQEEANAFLRNLTQSAYGEYWRGVLLVDPFGTQLEWETVEHIAELQRLDTWILFPISAIARMLPLSWNSEDMEPALAHRLDVIYGNRNWRSLYTHSAQNEMFNDPVMERERGTGKLSQMYQERLKSTFGTRLLTQTRTLRNTQNSPLFEFIFCAGHPKGKLLPKESQAI